MDLYHHQLHHQKKGLTGSDATRLSSGGTNNSSATATTVGSHANSTSDSPSLDDNDVDFDILLSHKEPRFHYTKDGAPIDPLEEILSDVPDTYITSGQFIRVRDEKNQGVQCSESLLLFLKGSIVNLKMPNDLRSIYNWKKNDPMSNSPGTAHQHHSSKSAVNHVSKEVDMDDFGAGVGSLGNNFVVRRRGMSPVSTLQQPVMRGSGNLRIDANMLQGYNGINIRKKCNIGWRLSFMSIQSIEPCIYFDNMFTIWYYDEKKLKSSGNGSSGGGSHSSSSSSSGGHSGSGSSSSSKNYLDSCLLSRTYECEDRAERDEWIVLQQRLIRDYYQRVLEKSFIPAPEVYQYHLWVQKAKKKTNPFRLLFLSNERIYMLKMCMGEENVRNSKIDFIYPIESVIIKRLARTPNAVSLQFDKAMLSRMKVKLTIDRVDFRCRDVLEMTQMFKRIALCYHRKTKKLPDVHSLDEELKAK